MTCDEVQADFDELLNATLPTSREAELRAHLDTCSGCRSELRFAEDLQSGLAATRASDEERSASDAAAATRVLSALAHHTGGAPPVRRAPRRKGRARPEGASSAPIWGALVVVACVVGLGALVVSKSQTSGPQPTESRRAPLATPSQDVTPSQTPAAKGTPTPATTPTPSPRETPRPSPTPRASPSPSPRPFQNQTPQPSQPSETPEPSALPSPAATPSPGGTGLPGETGERELPAPGEVLAGRISEVVGRAYALREGKRRQLVPGDSLRPGEALEVGSKGVVACSLASAQGAPLGQVLIGPKSTLSLARLGGLALTRGSAWIEAEGTLHVTAPNKSSAPESAVEVRRGDALLTRRRGGLQVDALAGEVRLLAPELLEIPIASQLYVDVRGSFRPPRRQAFRAPRWSNPRPPVSGVFVERFQTWPQPYPRTRGSALAKGRVRAQAYQGAEEIWFGRSAVEGGLTRVRRGLLRLRFRVAKPTRLTLQVMNHTQNDNFNASRETQRAGLWTQAEFFLGDLADNAKQGKRITSGDLLGYVTLRAPPEAKLELREVRID